jgi:hypothetical protein
MELDNIEKNLLNIIQGIVGTDLQVCPPRTGLKTCPYMFLCHSEGAKRPKNLRMGRNALRFFAALRMTWLRKRIARSPMLLAMTDKYNNENETGQ